MNHVSQSDHFPYLQNLQVVICYRQLPILSSMGSTAYKHWVVPLGRFPDVSESEGCWLLGGVVGG